MNSVAAVDATDCLQFTAVGGKLCPLLTSSGEFVEVHVSAEKHRVLIVNIFQPKSLSTFKVSRN